MILEFLYTWYLKKYNYIYLCYKYMLLSEKTKIVKNYIYDKQ